MHSIANSTYPGNCGKTLLIPVTEDAHTAMKVKLPFASQLKIGQPFSVKLDEAIQAADRHIYVQGRPPNPLAFVEDWINVLRWEVNNLWDVRPAENCYLRDRTRNLTHEHYKRSGEILAEGLAIAFLENRLKLPRQRFFFINGGGTRPDLVVQLKPRHCSALLHDRLRFMVEVRSRQHMSNLSAEDRKELKKKKASPGMAGVLAIYCCYGEGEHRNKSARTRIHLADPPGNDLPKVSEAEVGEIAIHHYLRITSQIGLWAHRDHLYRAAEARGIDAPSFTRAGLRAIHIGIRRSEGGEWFRGREFNELVFLASLTPSSIAERDSIRDRVRRRVNAGELGAMVFRGLNERVLRLIEASDWLGLAEYRDAATTEHSVDRWVRSDGLFRSESLIDPGSDLAKDVIKSLRTTLQ
jgi:hypothetical protein